VSTAQDRYATAAGPKGARKLLDDRSFACPAHGQVADADDQTSQSVFAEDAAPIKEKADLNEPLGNKRQAVKQRPEERGPSAVATLENDVDGELLEIFSALAHGRNCRWPTFDCRSPIRECGRRDCR